MENSSGHVPQDRVEYLWSRHGFPKAPHHTGNRLMKGKARSSDLLNDREQEIVQRLASGLSDQQIADELFLSLHTVKWYNRQIYSKLCCHWIWWIIAPALSKPTSGRFFVMRQSGQACSTQSETPSELFRGYLHPSARDMIQLPSGFEASQAESGGKGQESTSRAVHRRFVFPAAMAGVRWR
jgi:DNA-binding CsgD family transcriptional regulator